MITDAELDRYIALADAATPGPWSIETCGEKGDGSEMIGVVYGPDDIDCTRPLSGHLPVWDDNDNEIDYYRDELVAECAHRNRNANGDAAFIAAAREAVPTLARELLEAREALRHIVQFIEKMPQDCMGEHVVTNDAGDAIVDGWSYRDEWLDRARALLPQPKEPTT